MKYLLFLLLFLVGCADNNSDIKPYPGKQPRSGHCHALYDLNYVFDVSKCEEAIANPKFKIGQRVLIKNYDDDCTGIILGFSSWMMSPIDEPRYDLKIYCDGNSMPDKDEQESNLSAKK